MLAIRSKRALTRRAPSTKYEEISYNLVVGESHSFLPPAGLLSLSFETLSLSNDYWPCVAAFAVGTAIVTESGCVHTTLPLVKSKRFMVILSLP